MGIEMKTLVVGPLDVNCHILWHTDDRTAVIIDPGGDADLIEQEIKSRDLSVRFVINTHGHFDHVGANPALCASLGVGLAIHPADAALLERAPEQALSFGLTTPAQPAPKLLLEDKAVVTAGSLSLEVIHTPGHSPGGVCLYIEERRIVFTGDTLFAGGIGRTDLPGGSYETLISSIKHKIFPLGDDVVVYPGHGPASTVGQERATNPYLTE